MDQNHRQVSAFHKFLEVLPHGKELDLVILKAHLLIEEQINLVIDNNVQNPKALKAIKLTCFQKILLAQALLPIEIDKRFWVAAEKLNNIRNLIAHNISDKGLNHKIDDFITSVPADWPGSNDHETFELSIWFLFVHISSFVENQLEPFVASYMPEVVSEN
jgi:hypothetical protein